MEKDTPFISVGNNELKNAEDIKAGDYVHCNVCGETHVVKTTEGKTISLSTMKCEKNDIIFLVGVGGKLINKKFKKATWALITKTGSV